MKSPYLLYQRGSVWYVRFESEKTFHSTGHTDRGDAEKYAQEKLKELGSRSGPDAKLKDYARDFFEWDTCRWVARQRAKKRPFTKAVADNRRGQLKNHIFPEFGWRKLGDLTAVEIEDWLVSLPLSNQTRNHILYTFSIVLREAKRDGIIDKNPAEDVEPMGKDFRPTPALSDNELAALFPVNPAEFANVWPQFQFGVMFALMVSSGMRPG